MTTKRKWLAEWKSPDRDYPISIFAGSLYGRQRDWFGLERISEIIYDDPALFVRFFDQAHEALAPEGRVVVLFSDIGRLVQPDVEHPLEAELAKTSKPLQTLVKAEIIARVGESFARNSHRPRFPSNLRPCETRGR